MKRILSISWLVAALACGSVKDRQACSVSTDCAVGQYCAHAEGEARCWADASAPVVQTVTASCASTPCLRDGVLHVEATISDDVEVLDASVELSLAPSNAVAMAPSQGKWVADVQLRTFPFAAYERNVVATVTARDGARNASTPKNATALGVTRLKWERLVDSAPGLSVTAPAVLDDGTAVVGGTNGKLYFVPSSEAAPVTSLVVGTGQITAAPAIGDRAIWVGSEDFTLYGAELDGSAVKPGIGVNTGGPIKGAVAVLPGTGKEWAFASSSTGFLGAASTAAGEYTVAGPTAAFAVGPIVAVDGRVYAANTSGSLRAYRFNTSPAVTLTETWSAAVGLNVAAGFCADQSGAIWTGTLDAKLSKTTPGDTAGTVTPIATLPSSIVDSPVVLANGDLVVGDQNGTLHRFTASGTQVWSNAPNLLAAIASPIVVAGGDATLIVGTAAGKLFALRDDGTELWSTPLDTGNTLRAPNLYTPPGQTSNIMSTAYVASSSGKLFAVIVDGQLDAAAPWPKAFHDPRNTNRAGPQP